MNDESKKNSASAQSAKQREQKVITDRSRSSKPKFLSTARPPIMIKAKSDDSKMTFAAAKEAMAKRKLPKKVWTPPHKRKDLTASNTVTGPNSIAELARALKNDADLIFEWVYSNIEFHPTFGVQKGALGCLQDGFGNSFDQSALMVELLREAGYTASYVFGTIRLLKDDINQWLGTQVSVFPASAHDVLYCGQIPYEVHYSGLSFDYIDLQHCWVRVTIDATDYEFDPSYKVYNYVEGIDLQSAMDYDAEGLVNDAEDGATITADYTKDLNRDNVLSDLTTYASNLTDYIKTNMPGATFDDVVGGRTIAPLEGAPFRNETLSYEMPDDDPTVWTGDIDNAYRITVDFSLMGIEESFYGDDLHNKRVTITFNESWEPSLKVDGSTVATGDAGSEFGFELATLTVTHPYAETWADQEWLEGIFMATGVMYLIGTTFGPVSRSTVALHEQRLAENRFAGYDNDDERVFGESMCLYWATNMSQAYLSSDLHDRLTGSQQTWHHGMGLIGYNGFGMLYINIQANIIAYTTRTGDFAAAEASGTSFSFQINAMEGGTLQQFFGYESSGLATSKVIDKAIADGQKIFDATTSNWSTNVEPNLINWDSGAKSQISSFWLPNDWRVVLPENGQTVVGTEWEGYGWYGFYPDYRGLVGILAGGFFGGGLSISITPEDPGITGSLPPIFSRQYPAFSQEPINLFTGDYEAGATDITVGSAPAPYGLAFSRQYNSGSRLENGPLGLGWKHNFQMSVEETSEGFRPMGTGFATESAAFIAMSVVGVDLMMDQSKPLTETLICAIGAQWLMDNISANAVVVKFGHDSLTFVKAPDGSFSSFPASAAELVKNIDGTYTYTTPQKVTLNFNEDKVIDTIVYPFGMTTSFTYDDGKLNQVDTGLGRTLSFDYTGDKLTTVSDEYEREVIFDFDDDNLQTVTDLGNEDTVYVYDQPGRLTQIFRPAHPMDPVVTNVYDSLNRVMEQTDAEDNTWTYFFAGSRSEEVDPLDNSKVIYFNKIGNPLRHIDALGNVLTKEWDGLNRLVALTLPEGNSTEVQYDANHNVTQMTYHAKPGSGLSDIVVSSTYDPDWNRVATSTDALLNVTTFEYDSETGQIISIQAPEVDSEIPETLFSYTESGQLFEVIDPTGIATHLTYSDTNETLESVVHDFGMDRLNLTMTLGYDDVGNINSLTDPRSNETTLLFNDLRQLTNAFAPDPFGFETQLDFDENGNLKELRRQTGNISVPWQTFSRTFTKSDQIDTQTDPLSHMMSFGYDELRRVQTVEDAESRSTTTNYNERGRIGTVFDAVNNAALTITYSENGLIASITDANNNETVYTRDGFDRLHRITYPDSTYEEFGYDDNGNTLSFLNRNGDSTAFEYDELNRLREKSPDNQPVVSFEYDLASRILTISTPTVGGHPESGTYQYGYDTAGRITTQEMPDSKIVGYELDENGNVTKITYPDGYFIEREYDELNRLVNIKLNGSGSPALVFEYDDLSRRTSLTYANGVTTEYSYNDDDTVDGIDHTFSGSSITFGYGYNNTQQVNSQSVSDGDILWHPSAGGTISYSSANSLNQYSSVASVSQSYDDNGCLTGDGTWTFGYDTENHLTSADKTGVSATYLYDPQHRQVQKEVNSTKTRFVYDGLQRIADYDGSDTLQKRYVYGTKLDEPLIVITSGGTPTYLHHDRLGSIICTSNTSGVASNKNKYSPFGESPSVAGSDVGFTGQRFDSETGLYYFKLRYYSPKLGRFLQPDPIGYSAGMNTYTYVSNDGLNQVDTLGLAGSAAMVPGPQFTPFIPGGRGSAGALSQPGMTFAVPMPGAGGGGLYNNPDPISKMFGVFGATLLDSYYSLKEMPPDRDSRRKTALNFLLNLLKKFYSKFTVYQDVVVHSYKDDQSAQWERTVDLAIVYEGTVYLIDYETSLKSVLDKAQHDPNDRVIIANAISRGRLTVDIPGFDNFIAPKQIQGILVNFGPEVKGGPGGVEG